MIPARPLISVVCIPVRDEEERIGACLAALAAQFPEPPDAVVLALNNCTDGTERAVQDLTPALPFAVQCLTMVLPADQSFAGHARRIAMEQGAGIAGPSGLLLTTDADSRAAPTWLEANRQAIAAGAEAVAGMAEIDPFEAALIPSVLHEDDASECAYAEMLDEIASLLDPDPDDPWPRHDQENGASIAVTVGAWRQAGGMPPVRLAEDRAFLDALRRVDARIRHAPDARVTVSGRIHGRAKGGMADTIRRRLTSPDLFLDERLESARRWAQRCSLRHRARGVHGGAASGRLLAADLGIRHGDLRMLLRSPWFGAAWSAIEACSPVLHPLRVPIGELPGEVMEAGRLLTRLRLLGPEPAADRAGRIASAS